jgi:hypothetical protein
MKPVITDAEWRMIRWDNPGAYVAGLRVVSLIQLSAYYGSLRQLTAGPATIPIEWLAAHLERALRDLAACRCEYVNHYARFAIGGRHTVRAVTKVIATGFTINPQCPHHGEARRGERFGAEYRREIADFPWELYLTDDSERGHDDADPT